MKNIKIEIKWAAIFLAVTFIWMFLEKITGLHDEHIDKHPIFTNVFAIPAIVVYVLALLDKRKNSYEGVMTYKQAFISGLIITAILTVLAPLTQYVVSVLITPNYFDSAINYAVEQNKMTLSEAQAYFNLKSFIIQTAIGTPFMGIVTTAIISLFVKKKSLLPIAS